MDAKAENVTRSLWSDVGSSCVPILLTIFLAGKKGLDLSVDSLVSGLQKSDEMKKHGFNRGFSNEYIIQEIAEAYYEAFIKHGVGIAHEKLFDKPASEISPIDINPVIHSLAKELGPHVDEMRKMWEIEEPNWGEGGPQYWAVAEDILYSSIPRQFQNGGLGRIFV